jgi:hypothetical protein
MFSSWEELGYSVDGFDLLVEAEQPTGTDDSQSRSTWPDFDDLAKDRAQRNYKVALPDLNGRNFTQWGFVDRGLLTCIECSMGKLRQRGSRGEAPCARRLHSGRRATSSPIATHDESKQTTIGTVSSFALFAPVADIISLEPPRVALVSF